MMPDRFEYRKGIVISNQDTEQIGRCQIRILPEFLGVADSDLPWMYPAELQGGGGSNGSSVIPEIGEYVDVIIKDKYWQKLEYRTTDYTINNFPYSAFQEITSKMGVDLTEQTYPQPIRIYKIGQNFVFANSSTNELGFYNANGSYFLFDLDGNIIQNSALGKVDIKSNVPSATDPLITANLYTIVYNTLSILQRILTPGTLLGNLANPIVFTDAPDLLTVTELIEDTLNLLKSH